MSDKPFSNDDYARWAHQAVDWSAHYRETLRERPVRANVTPGALIAALPGAAPEAPEPMADIFVDFERLIPDGMTHWQHPRFFAYFPANAAPASLVAEVLVAAMGAQCMLWQTSPAATELETVTVDWLRQALALPDRFRGTLHDSASTATLASLLTMRERALDYAGLTAGLSGQPVVRVYTSAAAHSSVDKAARIVGLGTDHLVRVACDADGAMCPDALQAAIDADLAAGYAPAGVVATIGATSTGVSDRLDALVPVVRAAGLYLHVDAAWAGSAMICPELRPLWRGIEGADSIVFNPHKWLGAPFDCSVQFLADPAPQRRALGVKPAYLRTPGVDEPVDYSDWTVPLGRRFRALKLWFLLRAYGLHGLRARIRDHLTWAAEARAAIGALPGVTLASPLALSLFTFRGPDDATTEAWLRALNDAGRVYVTPTVVDGRVVIRFQVGAFDGTREDVLAAVEAVGEVVGAV